MQVIVLAGVAPTARSAVPIHLDAVAREDEREALWCRLLRKCPLGPFDDEAGSEARNLIQQWRNVPLCPQMRRSCASWDGRSETLRCLSITHADIVS
jgi:hypothetical protein